MYVYPPLLEWRNKLKMCPQCKKKAQNCTHICTICLFLYNLKRNFKILTWFIMDENALKIILELKADNTLSKRTIKDAIVMLAGRKKHLVLAYG